MTSVHDERGWVDLDVIETFDLDEPDGLFSDEPYDDECPVLPDEAYYPDDEASIWWAQEVERIERLRDAHAALYDGDGCPDLDYPAEYPCDGWVGHPA